MIKAISLAFGASLLLLSDAGFAQFTYQNDLEQSYGSADFVSIATGRKQSIAKAPAVASVITAEDIRAIGARDITEVLETVPGVHVSRQAAGYNPIFVIRGIHSEFNPQVLMLVNGVPITSVFLGNRGQAWAGMPVESISRIEVIRGPGSAVYGADAFAGTINIVTKAAKELEGFEFGGSSGSFNEQRAWIQYGGDVAGWKTAVSLELLDTDGQSENISIDTQTQLDALFSPAPPASLAPGSVELGRESIDIRVDTSKDDWRFRVGYQGRKDGGLGAGSAQALDPVGEGESDRFNADITYHNQQVGEHWDVKAVLSYFDINTKTDLVLFPPGAFGGAFPNGVIGRPEVYERHYRMDASAFYSGFNKHDIRIGAGYHYQDQYRIEEKKNFRTELTLMGPAQIPLGGLMDVSDTMPFNREEDRTVTYFFVQDEWQVARDWTVTGGVRYDNYSDFGDTVNPRVAVVWDTSNSLTTKLLYGRAFRAPSFAEQFNINNPIAVGNSDLDPEVINTYELAFDYKVSSDLRVGVNIFSYEMKDIIRFTPVAQNTGDQSGDGLELEVNWRANDNLNLIGNVAYQDSEDEQTNTDAPNAPKQQYYLRADYRLASNWSVSSQVNHVRDRKRAFGDPRSDIDDYTTIDLTLRAKDLMPGFDLAISVRNLTDEDALEPSLFDGLLGIVGIPGDLPLAGRSVFAEIRKTWR